MIAAAWLVCMGTLAQSEGAVSTGSAPVVLENDCVRWELGADGRTVHFTDQRSGQDYFDPAQPAFAPYAKKDAKTYPVTAVAQKDVLLTCAFGESGITAILRTKMEKRYFVLEVVSVSGGPDELGFLDIPLSLKGRFDEPFACCVLALNLKTNVPEIPGPNARLRAACYSRFGMEGAKAAILACPQSDLRDVMKEAVSAADELPRSNIGGPWALDAEIGRGSYLFDFGKITEETVDEWIAFVKSIGLNQIDFHTGTSLRFGDCAPNPKLFPKGRASVKAVLDKLHAAGIAAGLHTYAFFIAKDTPYVTPVPDPRLGKDAAFTLAEALSADAATVIVEETTKDMSTITGFFVHNSITLQIGDELITYSGVAKEPPYGFTGCTRGAYGTKAAAHEKGAKVHHLKECFGLFTPDGDSTLLAEIAANSADTFNECGFDMMYLDALDGEAILGGAEHAWHYGSKFVFEIANRLKKPALFEMSTFHHHLWYVRARMGAWDHPTRSHKRFVDVHCQANRDGAGMFLPMNLGWWAVQTWNDNIQSEPTFPDDIEYLMGKALGNDMGISLMGVDPSIIKTVPAYQRLAPIFKNYEDLRHAKCFSEAIKAKLRVPGDEFTLEQNAAGRWQFVPVQYTRHKAQGTDESGRRWTVNNPYAAQPLQVRIEALMAASPYDSPEGVVIEDFGKPDVFGIRENQSGVSAELEASTDKVKDGAVSGHFTAVSDRAEPDGSWSKIARTFTPPLNIAAKQALGVWVHGDGQGELLNIQLRSPLHTTSLGYGDHYIPIDFTGWRYFELIEPEGAHIDDFAWPYRGSAYAIYRENVDYAQVETLALWYNLLPQGKPVACHIGPIKALPLAKVKLHHPKVTIAGKTIVFPVDIESGGYLEFRSMTDCTLYGPKGEVLAQVKPEGEVPELQPGENMLEFACETIPPVNPRAYVTAITRGEPLADNLTLD